MNSLFFEYSEEGAKGGRIKISPKILSPHIKLCRRRMSMLYLLSGFRDKMETVNS